MYFRVKCKELEKQPLSCPVLSNPVESLMMMPARALKIPLPCPAQPPFTHRTRRYIPEKARHAHHSQENAPFVFAVLINALSSLPENERSRMACCPRPPHPGSATEYKKKIVTLSAGHAIPVPCVA